MTSALGGWLSVCLLAVAVAISIMDRTVINLLIEPIKHSLGLTDTQIALMNSVSFGVFYCIFALIMGRMIDHGNRRRIIIFTVVAWSLVMSITGFARNFPELTVCRIALAVGEAALAPAAFSIIADLFPKPVLGRAISTFYTGSILGPGLALLFGGAMIKLFSSLSPISLPGVGRLEIWQAVLMSAGPPGLVIAVLLSRFVREPERRTLVPDSELARRTSSFPGLQYLFAQWRLYGGIFAALALISMNFVSMLTWTPTYLIRVYGWRASSTGYYMGIIVAVGGATGAFAGGWLADRLVERGRQDGVITAMAIMATLSTPFAFSAVPILGADKMLMSVFFYCFGVMGTTSTAPTLIQIMTPNQLRGQVSALYLTLLNIATLALAPLCVALLTDYVFRNPQALGLSLTVVAMATAPASTLCFWLVRRTVRDRLELAIGSGM